MLSRLTNNVIKCKIAFYIFIFLFVLSIVGHLYIGMVWMPFSFEYNIWYILSLSTFEQRIWYVVSIVVAMFLLWCTIYFYACIKVLKEKNKDEKR